MNDQEAVRHIKRGDIGGLEALVVRYQVEAARVAYLITRDHQMAEDVMQTAFVQAYDHIDQYDPGRPFPPWFFRIVANTALKALRRDRIDLNFEIDLAELLPDMGPGPEEALSAAEARQMVWQAMGAISPEQRAVLVMRYYLSYSENQIAVELGRPIGTVRWRIHAARQKLRGILSGAQKTAHTDPVEVEKKVESHE